MENTNFMSVIKEANKNVSELKKNWKDDNDVVKHYKPFYEKAKDCGTLEFFITICIQDVKYGFIGGGVVKTK